MPIYQYICKKCQYSFEEMRKIDERNIPCSSPCPKCGGNIEMSLGQMHIEFIDPYRLGIKKPPEDWRSFINRLAKIPGASKNIRTF